MEMKVNHGTACKGKMLQGDILFLHVLHSELSRPSVPSSFLR